jgi:hypothetical protein
MLNGLISKGHLEFFVSEIMCAKHRFLFDVTGMEDSNDFLGSFI